MITELNPAEELGRVLRLWWVIALSMIVFGAVGYLIHTLRPPVYEATATFNVWLDFNYLKTDREFTEYDEDLSINAVGNAYVSPAVLQQVTAEALKKGWIKTDYDLILNYRLERKHEGWDLRYQSTDPGLAMDLVNYWAAVGYQYQVEQAKAETYPTYVRFSQPTLAVLPVKPVRYGRNNMVLAGALFGLVAGIFLSGWLARKKE